MVQGLHGSAGDGVELGDAVDLVAEELHADGPVFIVGGVQLHRVAPDAEHVALEGHVVALVPVLHQTAQQLVPIHGRAGAQGDHHAGEVVRLAQTVDAADGGHYDHVTPLQQGAGGAEPQAVDLLVGRGVLLDIGVGVGDIGLRLVVVVVGDKVLHGVFREELPELLAQLGGQRLVVGQHQRGALHLLDDLGHGVGLAGAGDALEHLFPQAQLHALGQLFDGLRLVARGGVFGMDFELRHRGSPLECFALRSDLLLSTVTKVGKNTGRNLRFLHLRARYNVYKIVSVCRTITEDCLFRFVKESSLHQRRYR